MRRIRDSRSRCLNENCQLISFLYFLKINAHFHIMIMRQRYNNFHCCCCILTKTIANICTCIVCSNEKKNIDLAIFINILGLSQSASLCTIDHAPGLLTRTSDFDTDENGVSIVFEWVDTCPKLPNVR